MFISLLTAS